MNKLKLNFNQFSDNYNLIAIHSNLDEFRLAYFLNKKLNIGLKRKQNDINIIDQDAKYSIFEFIDRIKFLKWVFFSNKSLVSDKVFGPDVNLFDNQKYIKQKVNLINEFKDVDYFILIENVANEKFIQKIIRKISDIKGVITSYITNNNIVFKENLIFS